MSPKDKFTLPPPTVSSVPIQVFVPSHLDYGPLLEEVMERMTCKLDPGTWRLLTLLLSLESPFQQPFHGGSCFQGPNLEGTVCG